ncbi:MAG TPA: flagellar hook-basal body complex protein FliE [Terriglobales bacterium]|nr:flagellar hook-basal body complex protein FliE [Terriglobales bacterium]
MSINAFNPNLPIRPSGFPQADGPRGKSTPGSGFGDALRDAVSEVDTLNLDAGYKVSSLVEGNGMDVHEAMIAVQKADLSFQLMLQVRNKVVQAYQQIAGMQF